MELHATRELRRNARLDKIMGKKVETVDAPAKAQAPQQKKPTDKLTLSRQALAFVEEQNRNMWDAAQKREQRRQNRMDAGISAMESAKGELDLLSKGLKVLELCQKIAASIMKGNRVPRSDLEFLMKNDPDGYRLAMAMRRQNPDPEDEESVLPDEVKNGSAEGVDSGESLPVDASGISGGHTGAIGVPG